ncbi:MAG TPA: TetR/AcrR family transcriptional regulator [Actinospica sp.]|nr:TetR/AcrR family transcriptional regulator [Actinospica sp.]
MPNRSYHHGDLRAALLEQAEATLREKGAAALSLRELARDLGVSHAAPSRHFKDRRALLDALAMVGFERMTALLVAADPGPQAGFPKRVDALARATVDFGVGEPELIALMFSRKQDTDVLDEMHEAWMRLAAPMYAVIADGQRSGDVHQGDIERIALSAFVTVHGVADLASIGVIARDEIPQALGDAVEHLIRGLRPERS